MKKTSFFTVELGQWPIVITTFNRELSKDPLQEAKDMREWIEHFDELINKSQKEGCKFIGIYDHTHHQYPSSVFRIKTMHHIKEKFDLMKKGYSEFIMIMPSMVTRMALKAALSITKFPAPVKLVSNLQEAINEAKNALILEEM
jgi:hypothetical protein